MPTGHLDRQRGPGDPTVGTVKCINCVQFLNVTRIQLHKVVIIQESERGKWAYTYDPKTKFPSR